MRVLITAAGTGGHINPAIAIADKIKEEEKDAEFLFIGTYSGLENDLVPRAGYSLEHIEAYGLLKEISFSNLRNFIKTFRSKKDVLKIIDEFKPDIVIGTGGYICVPVFRAAFERKIPTLLHESNAFPGKAIRFLSKKTDKILLGFNKSKEFFDLSDESKLIYVGNPTKNKKQNFTEKEKSDILKPLGLKPDLPIVLIFGGSQGAFRINKAVIEMIEQKKIKDFQIINATGQKQYDNVKEELEKKGYDIKNIENTAIIPYIYNMQDIMSIADLIVSRAGAMTVTEVANFGKPAIFIPFPTVRANRQIDNAKVLEDISAAKIIPNNDLSGEVLSDNLSEIIFYKNKLEKMGENALKLKTEGVLDKIYKEIKELLN